MERFAGLNICSFSPMKFFMEVLLQCLDNQYLLPKYSRKDSHGTLENRKSLAQQIFPRFQYSIKSKQTRCIKNLNFRKEVGIAIKSKETSCQLELVRNSYVAIMHQPVTINSTI